MSDLEGTIVPSESPVEGSESAPEVDTAGEHKPPREQRYRVERNQAREALEAANARIESLLSRQVERIAAESLAEPGDVFTLSGKSLADFLTEDGEIDEELVSDAVKEVLAQRPGLRKAVAHDPSHGLGGSANKALPTFADLFRS